MLDNPQPVVGPLNESPNENTYTYCTKCNGELGWDPIYQEWHHYGKKRNHKPVALLVEE